MPLDTVHWPASSRHEGLLIGISKDRCFQVVTRLKRQHEIGLIEVTVLVPVAFVKGGVAVFVLACCEDFDEVARVEDAVV